MSTPEIVELARQPDEARQEVVRLGRVVEAVGSPVMMNGAPPAVARLESIIDTRVVNKIGIFSGADDDWKAWCFNFESTAGLVDLDQVLVGAVTEGEPTPDIQLRLNALYHLFVPTTR